jgi:nucleoside-diphosphate-sugar epimerase
MRVLVTGATGRVGSRLVPHLLRRGDAVRILARQPERADALRQQGAEVVAGDVLRPETLPQAVKDTEAVVHLAAFFRGATPEQATAVNQEGALALAQVALQAAVPRFAFISTNLVYGPGRGRPAREGDMPQPAHPYPRSKAAAEHALLDLYRSRQLGLRILRLAFVYGEGDPHLREVMQGLQHWNPHKRFHMVHHADVA